MISFASLAPTRFHWNPRPWIFEGRDIFTHSAARGLEAGVPELEALLLDIPD